MISPDEETTRHIHYAPREFSWVKLSPPCRGGGFKPGFPARTNFGLIGGWPTEYKAFKQDMVHLIDYTYHPSKFHYCRPLLDEYLDTKYNGLWHVDFDERCDYARAWLESGQFVEFHPVPQKLALLEILFRDGVEVDRSTHHLNRWGLYSHCRGHAVWRRLVRTEDLYDFHLERLALWEKTEDVNPYEIKAITP